MIVMVIVSSIEVEHKCPQCGTPSEEYQIRDAISGGRFGEEFFLGSMKVCEGDFYMYGYCGKCSKRTEARSYVKCGILYKVTEIQEDGTEKVVAECSPAEAIRKLLERKAKGTK